jgi:hypothetical protein
MAHIKTRLINTLFTLDTTELEFVFDVLEMSEKDDRSEMGEELVHEILRLTELNEIDFGEDFYFKVGSKLANFILICYIYNSHRLGLSVEDHNFEKNNIKIFGRPIVLDKDINEFGLKIIIKKQLR